MRRQSGTWSLPPAQRVSASPELTAGGGAPAFIAVDPGTDQEAEFPMIFSWLMVGRLCAGIDEDHRLLVSDPGVSGDHLEIRVDVQEGRAWVVDVSKNGTALNGGLIEPNEPVPLGSGDLLELGSSSKLRFRSGRLEVEDL